MMNKPSIMWSVSLLVISMVTIVISITNIFGIELPNVLRILLGVIDLVALPVLIYTSVKSMKSCK